MTERAGYRGYVASRPVRGQTTPQQVQNLVIRDYASARGLLFKLSAVEYAMPGCTMMLEEVLAELPRLEGFICFSMFMLPEQAKRRREVYRRVLAAGASLHAALENLALTNESDVGRLEDLFQVERFAARLLARLG